MGDSATFRDTLIDWLKESVYMEYGEPLRTRISTMKADEFIQNGPGLVMEYLLHVLSQGMWDARKELGFDNDGDESPMATVVAMGYEGYAAMHVREAKEFRREYEAAINNYEEMIEQS